MSAACSRTASRRARAAAFIPPPAGYRITPAYRIHRPTSRRHAARRQPFNLCITADRAIGLDAIPGVGLGALIVAALLARRALPAVAPCRRRAGRRIPEPE